MALSCFSVSLCHRDSSVLLCILLSIHSAVPGFALVCSLPQVMSCISSRVLGFVHQVFQDVVCSAWLGLCLFCPLIPVPLHLVPVSILCPISFICVVLFGVSISCCLFGPCLFRVYCYAVCPTLSCPIRWFIPSALLWRLSHVCCQSCRALSHMAFHLSPALCDCPCFGPLVPFPYWSSVPKGHTSGGGCLL